MAGSLTVTISNLSGLGPTKRAEASEIKNAIDAGLTLLVSAHQTSVTLYDRNRNNIGSMSWTPAATT
jgi:hypothetical protein